MFPNAIFRSDMAKMAAAHIVFFTILSEHYGFKATTQANSPKLTLSINIVSRWDQSCVTDIAFQIG